MKNLTSEIPIDQKHRVKKFLECNDSVTMIETFKESTFKLLVTFHMSEMLQPTKRFLVPLHFHSIPKQKIPF